jgi:thiol-disulfide isomerase/thioredoxin
MLLGALGALGCEDKTPAGPAPSRFAAVKSQRAESALGSFCEQTYPGSGAGSRKFVAAPNREVPGLKAAVGKTGSWQWLNLWATWCVPCVEEMALLGRWKQSLADDGLPVDLVLMSIDEEQAALEKAVQKPLPGRVEWLRATADLPVFLESLGADKTAPIPIHVLIDPRGMVRCVRVGSVHDRDYGAVKAILSSG